MRENNLQMLNDTLLTLTRGFYPAPNHLAYLKLSMPQRKHSVVLFPDDVVDLCSADDFDHTPPAQRCVISCENIDSFSMARKRAASPSSLFSRSPVKEVLVLNFANAFHPGGGVRHGANAQEEDLCRKSTLLCSLESEEARKYYEYNRSLNTNLGSDAMIFTPKVEIIKDADGNYLEQSVIVSVLTCAAPNISFGLEGLSPEEYEALLYRRIVGILKCSAYLGYRHLVLGAFGCGAFHNDARLVSDLFYRALKDFSYDGIHAENLFASIDFAVLSRDADQYNFKEFSRNFADYYQESQPEPEQPKPVLFWKTHGENGYLSNWYPSSFVIDDFCYRHVEQYLMACKAKMFHDSIRYTAILRADTPEECKKLGRAVSPFDSAQWSVVRHKVLLAGLYAKFSQNDDLRKQLLSTGDSLLAEASPKDSIFGIGIDAAAAVSMDPSLWPGENILGQTLMEVRQMLRQKT